jgi:hypothetical protein
LARLSHKTKAVKVAPPDDETSWVGGTILSNPSRNYVEEKGKPFFD